MKNFKPQLLPNNPVGIPMDWEALLGGTIQNYLVSIKEDGARVELQYDTQVKGRSLKSIPNVHIQRMHQELQEASGRYGGVLEAEFYSPNMNFSEIMHFFKTADITSEHTYVKYKNLWNKSNEGTTSIWPYPGRDVEWCTTWHPCLKFYVFDYYLQDKLTKLDRYLMSKEFVEDTECEHIKLIHQFKCPSLEHMYEAYDQASMQNSEGLVLIHKDAPYKFGRHTLNSGLAYKVKDDNLAFDGQIIRVEEATEVREGVEKTINELGRSVTSKLAEDRVPSGMAKGFLIRMEDGNELTVSLTGYNHDDRRALLACGDSYIGKWIRFTGMAPVKEGGCPRHAHFTKGNFRDDK
jgi:hypothetical protein